MYTILLKSHNVIMDIEWVYVIFGFVFTSNSV